MLSDTRLKSIIHVVDAHLRTLTCCIVVDTHFVSKCTEMLYTCERGEVDVE